MIQTFILPALFVAFSPLADPSHISLLLTHMFLLQVMVWGDYGRMDRKVFMGVAQINLDDLELSNIVFGWYKLFTISTITGSAARRSSQSSLDSAYSGSR